MTPARLRMEMSAPDLNEDDFQAVDRVVRSGRLALGPACAEFERAIAEYVGTRHAVAVSSGTAALHLLVKALDIGPGDEVLVPSFTFAASVNAILYEGATPVFVDCEPAYYQLDPRDVEARITSRTKAIMAVDVFGHPCDWDALDDVARRHDLAVIDDSCEALGAAYKGRKIGRFGRAAAFAFYPNKQITTGEGGMIVTDDDAIAELCRSYRNQGRGAMGAWLQHDRLGYNYRLDELSAALGASQMRRLDGFLAKRQWVANEYSRRLAAVDGVDAPRVSPDATMSWFVYVVTLTGDHHRDDVIAAMEASGVPARGYFSPVHEQPYVRSRFDPVRLPATEDAARRTLALPFHNNMTPEQIEDVVSTLDQSLRKLA